MSPPCGIFDYLMTYDSLLSTESPYQYLEKATVLQECRVFHDAAVVTQNPRRCCLLLTKMLFLLVKGNTFTSAEITEVFFGVTKLFQSHDVNLRRMMYLFIKEIAETCDPDDVIIVTSSLTKDMNTGEDLYRANSMRVLAKIIDAAMLGAIERYIKQAIVDRNAFVASSALVAGANLFRTCPDVVRRWINEVQEAVTSVNDMVQFHALSLLYTIKQHDRLAVSKTVQQLSKGSQRSPLATCLLIRYTRNLLQEDMNSTNAKAAYQFLETCLRHKNDMVIYEAAKAICNLPGVESSDLSPAITVLQLFLSSPKASLRFSAIRTLSSVATRHPLSIAKCNDDMESLVGDSNRAIATLAITTLLKTGSESSIDRLMKQISSFMVEIGDEFKVVVVQAVRELCVKYPQKNRVLVGFLATFLREEGGFDFKKCIVDSILELMSSIPETKETSLLHLCEFIEDCEFSELIVQVMHVIGRMGPSTAVPSRYIRFIFNRVILENAMVRAAAVSTLGIFATKLPELRPSIVILLRRSLSDEDDEVRDRAAILLHSFETIVDNESTLNFLLDQPLPMSFASLERSMRAYAAHPSSATSTKPITFTSLPIIEDAYVPAKTSQAQSSKAAAASSSVAKTSAVEEAAAADPAAALYKVPEFVQLGRPFRSTRETALTESEMEYVVQCVKHVFDDHMVLQFSVLNTIDDQRLQNVTVNVEGFEDGYDIEHVIPAEVARYGEPSNCFVSLVKVTEDPVPLTLSCELKFTVVQVDPTSGEVEGDEEGYEEEFPLEELDLSTNDYMAKVSFPDFRKAWEELGSEGEVIEKFSLQFKKLSDALGAVVEFLGMQPCDNTGVITAADASKKSHTLHLSGKFIGNTTVLVRAQLQLDETNGVVLKMAVRSESQDISTLVAECIQ
jgi:coatomer subunit gamma